MDSLEHMAHLADLGRRHVAEDIPVEMHHAALPSRLWQVLSRALHQAAAGIRNDQLHAREAAIDQVSQKRRPTGFVLLGALADAENLAKSFRVDRAGHQERDIANLTGPAALHHDAVEIKIRMLTFDPPAPPGLDLRVDLLVEVRDRAWLTRVPHSASGRSSTRRTEIPARYISISASSTELFRRR